MSMTWAESEPEMLPPLGPAQMGRLAARAVALFGATGLCLMLHLALRAVERMRHPSRVRGRGGRSSVAVMLWAQATLKLLGLRLTAVGRPLPGPGAMVANHTGWLDVVALMAVAQVVFVAKAEVRDWPLIGAIGRTIGTIFIKRQAVEARRQGAMLKARLVDGNRLVLFPEGTSTNGQQVLRFKSSLFEAFLLPEVKETLRIQPVTVFYRVSDDLPKTFYGWWGGAGLGRSLCDVLARSQKGEIITVFHRPLRAGDLPDRKTLALAAEEIIRRELEARLAIGREGAAPCADVT